MAGAQLLRLQRSAKLIARKGPWNRIATMAVNHANIVGTKLMSGVENVAQQRLPSQWLEHFRQVRTHARSLTCCKNDDAEWQA